MLWRLLIIIIVFPIGHVFSEPSPGASDAILFSRTQKPFTIHFISQDSIYVQDAFETLSRAFEEISFDLQLDRGDSFDIYIMPTRSSFRDALSGQLPSWTGAFANPSSNSMVLKSPRWNPDNSFHVTLVHELFHLLIHHYLGARELPRWMDEGLAIFYSREKRWRTATALSKAITTGSIIPLTNIDYVLEYHQAKADLAYQQSYSAVQYLLRTYDVDALRDILHGLKDDKSLDDCFLAATGSSYADFEAEWQNYVRRTYKWMWFYELDDYIWIFIFVLLVMAFVFRKLRNKKIEHEWREEPDAMEPNDDEDNLLL